MGPEPTFLKFTLNLFIIIINIIIIILKIHLIIGINQWVKVAVFIFKENSFYAQNEVIVAFFWKLYLMTGIKKG